MAHRRDVRSNTATDFWLRRRADGTHEVPREGLERLLRTYDAAWLTAM